MLTARATFLQQPVSWGKVAAYTILALFSVAMALPFVWMISTSFKLPGEVISYPPQWIPQMPTLKNYFNAIERLDIIRLYKNTLFIAFTKTILVVFTSAIIGYIFAKYRFRGREFIFYAMLATMIIPFEVYMIPLYLMMIKMGIGNTFTAVILPEIFSPYGIFLYRQFLHAVPTDLIDAARIDGATETRIFTRIILPLTKPALATLTIFYFLWEWNSFLWPLIVLTGSEKYTLAIGLANFVSEFFTDYGVSMAGATLSLIPILVVFIIMQRFFIESLTITGFKG